MTVIGIISDFKILEEIFLWGKMELKELSVCLFRYF